LVQTLQPLRLIITGTAGTGKSFIMKAASYLIERLFGGQGAARGTSVSGKAAEAINGFTTCSLAGLHPGQKVKAPSAQQAAKLQARFSKLIALFIDEMSLLSYQALSDFEHQVRCGVQKGVRSSDSKVCFGGLPIVVLLGDHGQLGPCDVGAVRLCDIEKKTICERGRKGRIIYLQFNHGVFLQRMQRQSQAGSPCWVCPPSIHNPGQDCAYFADMLHRMRFGKVLTSDFDWLKHRHIEAIRERDAVEARAFEGCKTLRLLPTRAAVHNEGVEQLEVFQAQQLREVGIQSAFAAPIRAENQGAARKMAAYFDDFSGIPAKIVLMRKMPVMLTTNIALPWGLFNGAVGTVRDIVFAEGRAPVEGGDVWPSVVLVEFLRYKGSALMPTSEGRVVPIFPQERSGTVQVGARRVAGSRKGFPLKSAFCATCHKAQGCTCGANQEFENVLVDLGDIRTEKWASALGFVALSRATEGKRVAISGDVSLNRVQQITSGATQTMVRREDARLLKLHEATKASVDKQESFESLVDWALDPVGWVLQQQLKHSGGAPPPPPPPPTS